MLADPEKYEKYLSAKHNRYLKRKAENKIKSVSNMSESERLDMRREWADRKRAQRMREKEIKNSKRDIVKQRLRVKPVLCYAIKIKQPSE